MQTFAKTDGKLYRSADIVSPRSRKFCLPLSFSAFVQGDPL